MTHTSLVAFSPFDKNGKLNVIVETPKGSRLKYDYDPKMGVFKPKRSLPIGVRFPYDFGFVPGTKCEDGDPIDVLVLHDDASFPGTLMACTLIGAIELSQKDDGERVENPRLIACPAWHNGGSIKDVSDRTREELEHFFATSTFGTGKKVKIEGWSNAAYAEKLVERHEHKWS